MDSTVSKESKITRQQIFQIFGFSNILSQTHGMASKFDQVQKIDPKYPNVTLYSNEMK